MTPISVTTVGDCLAGAAATWSHDALVLPSGRLSYPELDARVDEFACGLLAVGVGLRERVGLLFDQTVDYLAATVAVMRIGAVAVPINARYRAGELRHVVADSRMAVLLTSAGERPYVELVTEALVGDAATRVVVLDGPAPPSATSAEEFWAGAAKVTVADVGAASRRVRVRDVALLMYTSGTTANPKGAMITHEAIVRQSATVARTRLGLGPDDRVWTPFQLFHIGGIAFFLACCNVGATYVHTAEFRPDVAVGQLRDERITVALPGFETIWLAVLDHPSFDAEALTQLRIVFNIGVPERLRGMQARVPNAVQVSGFGGTEACGFLTIGAADDDLDARVNTTGLPLEGMEVRVIDVATEQDAAPGQLGEIRYRGYACFDGYFGQADLNRTVIDPEGWFHSGDMGWFDADGRLTYVTRLKDMLKVGGENVAAAEIESFLLTHPAVRMAQVVSAPDERYVEVACAYVILQPGAAATEQELVEHCLGTIATFKVPRYVRFVEDYPMSGTKVKKHVLRERIAAELVAAGITSAPKVSTRG